MQLENKISTKVKTISSKWVGFCILSLVVVLASLMMLLYRTIDIYFGLLLLGLFWILIGIFFEFTRQRKRSKMMIKLMDFIHEGGFVAIGVLSTYWLAVLLDIHVVTASAAVGLLGHLLYKRRAIEVYCGSFAGMSSALLFGPVEIVLVSIVTAIIFVLSKPAFKGFGGRLGTIAFAGSSLSLLMLGKTYTATIFDGNLWLLILVGVLGVVSTYIVQHPLKQTAVFASSVTTLIFVIIATLFMEHSGLYMMVFFAASFVGMADSERLPNAYMAIMGGILLGILYLIFIPYLNGAGGKLGTLALMAVIIQFGIIESLKWVQSQTKKNLIIDKNKG